LVGTHLAALSFGGLAAWLVLSPGTRTARRDHVPIPGTSAQIESVVVGPLAPIEAETRAPRRIVVADADAGAPAEVRPDLASVYEALLAWMHRRESDAAQELVPAEIVSSFGPYLDGWTDAVIGLAPDAGPELARRITGTLCADGTSGEVLRLFLIELSHRIAVGQFALREGLACELRRDVGHDGLTTWAALDVWRQAGFGADPVLERMRATSTDPRTQRRLRADGPRGPSRPIGPVDPDELHQAW